MFYNGPALYERPERYASMIVTFKIKGGKIEQMLLAPEYLSTEYQYYGGFREAPYTLDYFKPFLGEPLESRKFRVPCPNCGRLSEDLEWYTFNTKGCDSYHCYGGTVSICQHCKRTVEIFPIEQFENDSIDKSNYEDNEQKDKQAEIKLPNISYFSFVFSTPLAGTKYLNSLDDSEPLDGETTDPFDDHNFIKNSWSLLDFARIKGKMQLATINNQEDGKPFKVCVFTLSQLSQKGS
ncbi:MAG: hypothetical protein J6R30_05690 [Bacteroidales bacterium]|nr:hypothetical protein [Bacteroidales bacterium]